jgi:hypothetical protein
LAIVGADPARLWRLYAEHAAVLFRGGPRPTFDATDRWFFAATGSDHVDMNQAALFGPAGAEDAELLAQRVLAADVPCLLGCSDGVVERVAPVLTAAGFERMPKREAIFWRRGPPQASEPSAFDVRRVRSDPDIVAMQAIFEEAHGYDPASIAALYGGRVKGDDGLSAWLAWDGTEPISFTIVIELGPTLSIWEVMTPVRHRRRGAARAVVSAALAGAAAVAAVPIEETLFWASPAGRPLYEAMGFHIADDVDAWALGASAEDLAAVGA